MATANITVTVKDMPEVLATLQKGLATMLRSEAEGEPEFVAAKLRRIADNFETGIDLSLDEGGPCLS